jgi:hypothetical protein
MHNKTNPSFLQVLLLQGCKLSDASVYFLALMFKHHASKRAAKDWECTLRTYPRDRTMSGDIEAARVSGLVKIDLSNNYLTVVGVKVKVFPHSKLSM